MAKKPDNEPEWLTRKTRIDGKLRALGWNLVPHTEAFNVYRIAVTEYPTNIGPADYAFIVDGKVLGILEAKKLSLGSHNVPTQTQRYSAGVDNGPLQFGEFRVPKLLQVTNTSSRF